MSRISCVAGAPAAGSPLELLELLLGHWRPAAAAAAGAGSGAEPSSGAATADAAVAGAATGAATLKQLPSTLPLLAGAATAAQLLTLTLQAPAASHG